MTQTIKINEVVIYPEQRELNQAQVYKIAEKIKERGYNPSYPITIDHNNGLVDGGHRLEAAKQAGLTEVPLLYMPDTESRIRHAIVCNEDGADTRTYDVFDYAELCWKLGNQTAIKELNWSPETVTRYKNIKEKLCPFAWKLTKNQELVNSDSNDLVNIELTKVKWTETHFRAIFSYLSVNGVKDNAIMRAQVAVIQDALKQFADPKKKVTAKWIGDVAEEQAWYVKLAKYMRDHLVQEATYTERKLLLKNIRNGVFGKKDTDKSFDKFVIAISAINERILGVKLYCDDAFQRLPLFEDKSIALVVTDIPYNVTDKDWDKIGTDDEYLVWVQNWLQILKPKLKEDYHLFFCVSPHYQARIEQLLTDNGWPIKSRIIWSHRNLSEGRNVSDKFITMWEMIFHCGTHNLNWPKEWNQERFEVQEWAAPQSNFEDKKYHPNSKPLGLFELFIKVGSKPGDLIVDPFAGGGTTGEASKNIGQRQCVLIEQSDDYCQIIERRLDIKRLKDGGRD